MKGQLAAMKYLTDKYPNKFRIRHVSIGTLGFQFVLDEWRGGNPEGGKSWYIKHVVTLKNGRIYD